MTKFSDTSQRKKGSLSEQKARRSMNPTVTAWIDARRALPIPAAGLAGTRITWRCPFCLWNFRRLYLPLPELWTHFETEHGVGRSENGTMFIISERNPT